MSSPITNCPTTSPSGHGAYGRSIAATPPEPKPLVPPAPEPEASPSPPQAPARADATASQATGRRQDLARHGWTTAPSVLRGREPAQALERRLEHRPGACSPTDDPGAARAPNLSSPQGVGSGGAPPAPPDS